DLIVAIPGFPFWFSFIARFAYSTSLAAGFICPAPPCWAISCACLMLSISPIEFLPSLVGSGGGGRNTMRLDILRSTPAHRARHPVEGDSIVRGRTRRRAEAGRNLRREQRGRGR